MKKSVNPVTKSVMGLKKIKMSVDRIFFFAQTNPLSAIFIFHEMHFLFYQNTWMQVLLKCPADFCVGMFPLIERQNVH